MGLSCSAGWSGLFENYTLRETDSGTELLVELDTEENYREYFDKTFPKALDKVREMAEG